MVTRHFTNVNSKTPISEKTIPNLTINKLTNDIGSAANVRVKQNILLSKPPGCTVS